MTTSDLSDRMDWATKRIAPTREVLEPVMRSLYDLPVEASSDGAREVALLAAWRAAQNFAFEPIMQALIKLRERKWDAEQPFLLTDSVHFSWKTAPIRKYASFEDFYERELEQTWGKWTDLLETWKGVVRGDLTPDQGKERILGKRGGDRQSDNYRTSTNQADIISLNKHGTNAAYLSARLRRDHREIAERLSAGEFRSVRAAAIEAGIITPTPPLAIVRRAWKRATPDEREAIRAWVGEQP